MLLAAIIILCACLIAKNRNFLFVLLKQISLDIPSFTPFPVTGHFLRFYGLRSEDAFIETNKFAAKFPEMSKLWQFHHLSVFINSPDLIEKVLVSKNCLQRPLLLLKFFNVDEGLLSSRYEQWIHDRRFMNQFFTPKSIDEYMAPLSRCVELLIDGLRIKSSNEDFDLLPLLEKCALRGVCSTLFGMKTTDSKINEICIRTSEIFEANARTFEDGLRNPLEFLDFIHKRTANHKHVKSAHEFLTKLLTEMTFDHVEGASEPLLECLLKNEDGKFTQKQICDHILTYLNAGLDTTAAHLNYTVLFLAMHPDYQEKLYREVATVEKADHQSIEKLDYLDRVVKESFRLAPPIFLIGRETVEDFEIAPGIVIPKDTSLCINTFVLHRRQEIYGKDSDLFNPDNFLPEAVAKRHPYSFQPFSSGRRNCIGYKFAYFFIKLALAELTRNFQFTTKSEYESLKFKYGMTLKLTRDHLVSIERRNIE